MRRTLLSIVESHLESVDSRRGGTCRGARAIGEYRIICVVRRADGHVRAVGYSESGHDSGHDDLWTLDEARRAIQQGHRLFTVSPSTGVEVEVELHEESIRTSSGESVDHDLDDLPNCGEPDTLSRLGEVSERPKERDWKSRTC
jgi:hypothetical protein